jgi:hypothetical protein
VGSDRWPAGTALAADRRPRVFKNPQQAEDPARSRTTLGHSRPVGAWPPCGEHQAGYYLIELQRY